jgi:hypothetical protein
LIYLVSSFSSFFQSSLEIFDQVLDQTKTLASSNLSLLVSNFHLPITKPFPPYQPSETPQKHIFIFTKKMQRGAKKAQTLPAFIVHRVNGTISHMFTLLGLRCTITNNGK